VPGGLQLSAAEGESESDLPIKKGERMKTYVYLVEQWIEVKANSPEEAEGLLPMYPTGYEGQAHYVTEEVVELLRVEEGK
jgi:hypothetical protein